MSELLLRIIPPLLGAAMVTVFLGFYAIRLHAIPLWIIIIAILGMAYVDFLQSVREPEDSQTEEPPSGERGPPLETA